ncbi:sulfurtransferase TusA family protein [Natrinema versiforme]|uniref:SirA-like domain-containing protein n=1 Tax=Natrinema versiforme JCM 10478 TaxID=1227496 RepID=L9XTU7_9EURY|nr:sulfurtransferase TusA family protein [Natrinema versiforme]ELY65229.1 SirA-like domain-containing protein [Natrinema versiforme JCM 10478]
MPSIDDVTDTPDELSDDQAEELLEKADLVQDMMGEVCPYPQVEAKKGLQQIESGDLLVQETDHVPCTENVPRAVGDDADAQVWRSGDAVYRIYLRKR